MTQANQGITKEERKRRNALISAIRILILALIFLVAVWTSNSIYAYNPIIGPILIVVALLILVWSTFGAVSAYLNIHWSRGVRRRARRQIQITVPRPAMLIEEYRQAMESDRHLTSLNWQIASIVFTGIVAGLGLTVSHLGFGSLLISVLGMVMTLIWFLFVRRNRDIVSVVLREARRLENGQGPLTKLKEEREQVAGPTGFITLCGLVILTMSVLGGVAILSIPNLSAQFIWYESVWTLGVAALIRLLYNKSNWE